MRFVVTKLLENVGGRRVALAASAVVAVAACVLAVAWLAARPAPATAGAPVPLGAPLDPPAPADALVFVSGAVASPGLYRLDATARVSDAIAAAGGMTAQADLGKLPNLAARVHDGRQVNVPFLRVTASGGLPASARLDINSASADELAAVPGMPAGLPEAIVSYRADWGGFLTISDLVSALGVDRATVTALGHYLRVVPIATP